MNKILHCTAIIALSSTMSIAATDYKEYPDFYQPGKDDAKGISFVQSIDVVTPEYGSLFKGDLFVLFRAPAMKQALVRCWQQPTKENPDKNGHDAVLADISLDGGAASEYSFIVHGDLLPNGPITVRIQTNDGMGKQDLCELQLYNLGGVKWRQGIPKEDPPGAKGMKLVFADDFDGPLSISAMEWARATLLTAIDDNGIRVKNRQIHSLDCALVAPRGRHLLEHNIQLPSVEPWFNLYNNLWGTNFPIWFSDDMRFRFIETTL